jgi:hypothetical protein
VSIGGQCTLIRAITRLPGDAACGMPMPGTGRVRRVVRLENGGFRRPLLVRRQTTSAQAEARDQSMTGTTGSESISRQRLIVQGARLLFFLD